MRLYTKSGDEGKTSLIGGRTRKDDVRVEAYGSIDELNCFVGVAASEARKIEVLAPLATQLEQIQQELFDCGSDLAYVDDREQLKVSVALSEQLEEWMDQYVAEAPELTRFILPGGSQASSALHVCRGVCRRTERRVITMMDKYDKNPAVLIYLNRLSDYFFAAARVANARLGEPDTEYIRSAEVFRNSEK